MFKIKGFTFLLLLLTLILLFSGCSNDNLQIEDNEGKINIYTSDYVLADITQKIGGENVSVKNIIPPGVSSHDYEPTAKDIVALSNGDIFVYNGAGMERWLEKIIANLTGKQIILLDASQGIDLIKGNDDHDDHDDHDDDSHKEEESHEEILYDSHVWLNPLNTIKQAENVKNTLIEIDKDNESYYEENFANLSKKLIELDKKYMDELANSKRKEFFVSHAAFGYLAERYGLEQYSISGIIPSNEPSPAEMAEIINKAKELNIKYILVDPKDSKKISQVVASEINANIIEINTISSLTKDELQIGLDYFALMEQNLEVLKLALNE